MPSCQPSEVILLKIVVIQHGARRLTEHNKALLKIVKEKYLASFEEKWTTPQENAFKLTVSAIEENCSAIIAVGGDGTIHEVVNGVRHSGKNIPIIILPNGTANDLARGMQLDWNSEKLQAAIERVNCKDIDLIRMTHKGKVSWCVNIADTGFGGHVVQILNKQRNYLGGSFSYVLAILRSFISFRKPDVQVSCYEKEYKGPMLLAACCNGPMFGDGLYIAPEAKIDDGWMHVTLLGKVNFLDYVRNLSRLKRKQEIKHPEAFYFKTKKIQIQIEKGLSFTEADGELIGEGAIEFEIEPASLRLIVPFEE